MTSLALDASSLMAALSTAMHDAVAPSRKKFPNEKVTGVFPTIAISLLLVTENTLPDVNTALSLGGSSTFFAGLRIHSDSNAVVWKNLRFWASTSSSVIPEQSTAQVSTSSPSPSTNTAPKAENELTWLKFTGTPVLRRGPLRAGSTLYATHVLPVTPTNPSFIKPNIFLGFSGSIPLIQILLISIMFITFFPF